MLMPAYSVNPTNDQSEFLVRLVTQSIGLEGQCKKKYQR